MSSSVLLFCVEYQVLCSLVLLTNRAYVSIDCECHHTLRFDASESTHSDGATTAANEHKAKAISTSNEMAVLLYRAKAAAAESEVLRLHTEAAQIEVNTI
jgi:uncharacterized protein YqfA (UPF0365 family)